MLKRAAAILLPLFSLRSDSDLGRGEILDLPAFLQWMLEMRHRVLQLLPLSESDGNSPYNALSVFSIDPLYISVSDLPGVPVAELAHARKQACARPIVPRAELQELKLPLLAAAFHHFRSRGESCERLAFERFADENRQWLSDYALFRALKDRFCWAAWEQWPPEFKNREPQALAAARRDLDESIAMYSYWQFLARQQWTGVRRQSAGWGVQLSGDLAFSPSRDSADVWAHQDLFMLDRCVGAPPDAFSDTGQRWGLPMPNWPGMRAEGLAWWRMRVRHALGLFDLLRIDHVVGFYRTYSYPADSQELGAFYPSQLKEQLEQGETFFKMLKHEAGEDVLIGEDLGLVPDWVRSSLGALGVIGLKVFRWERSGWGTGNARFVSPAEYPEASVATTGTHDTQTLAGWWMEMSSADRAKLAQAMHFPASLNLTSAALELLVLDAILQSLYASPSRLTIAPIQDLFGWQERINLPGSIDENNWTYRLPMSIERLRTSRAIRSRVAKLAELAQRSGRC